jgi:hypothetical protein
MIHSLWAVAVAVLLFNLPFGYWRAGTQRLTVPWILAVHVPVPFVVALRIFAGVGWRFMTFPVLVGAFFTGQFIGGRLRRWAWRRAANMNG